MTQTQESRPIFEITTNAVEHVELWTFNQMLLEAVDSSLLLLGSLGKQAFYKCLNEKYGVPKEDIPSKLDLFAKALETVFGSAACLIEIQIMQTLHQNSPNLEFPLNANTFTFRRYVETLKAYL